MTRSRMALGNGIRITLCTESSPNGIKQRYQSIVHGYSPLGREVVTKVFADTFPDIHIRAKRAVRRLLGLK